MSHVPLWAFETAKWDGGGGGETQERAYNLNNNFSRVSIIPSFIKNKLFLRLEVTFNCSR